MENKTYITPEFHASEMKFEGVLCSSVTDATQTFNNSLQDYEATDGAW